MMRIACALVLDLALATNAVAEITNFRSLQVDNSTGGAALQGFVTIDIRIDFTGQYWGNEAIIELTSGSIYQDNFGGVVPPSSLGVSLIPSLGFDTYLSIGAQYSGGPFGDPSVIGGAADLGGPATLTFDSMSINAAWNRTALLYIYDQSDFFIGRFTFSSDANGTALFWGATNFPYPKGYVAQTFELQVQNGVIRFVPEPASAWLVGLGASAMCLICRKRTAKRGVV